VAKLPGDEMTGYPFKHGPVVCQNVVLPVMNLAPLALKQWEGKQLTKNLVQTTVDYALGL